MRKVFVYKDNRMNVWVRLPANSLQRVCDDLPSQVYSMGLVGVARGQDARSADDLEI